MTKECLNLDIIEKGDTAWPRHNARYDVTLPYVFIYIVDMCKIAEILTFLIEKPKIKSVYLAYASQMLV